MLAAMRDRFLAVAASALLSACAGTAPEPQGRAPDAGAVPATQARDPRSVSTSSAPGNEAARLALRMIGVPYRYGGADPEKGFDCSGLVYYTYTTNGYAVPRTAQDLFKAARKISLEDAIQGDLVFFQDQAKLSHVGIYLGRGMFVHAPSSGDAVSMSSLETPYYQRHLVAVGRLSPSRR
jgi:cell wall-associated NlpC family hydrolase